MAGCHLSLRDTQGDLRSNMDTIDQFMWGFQRHFRVAIRYEVEEALAGIGLPVQPAVVLVGFAFRDQERHEICVEPEDGVLAASALSTVAERAATAYDSGPDSQILVIGPGRHELYHAQRRRLMRAKVLAAAVEVSGAFAGMTFFASASAPVGGYEVHTCVGIPTPTLQSLPAFDEDEINRTPVGRSLPHAVLAECLRRADDALYLPDPGAGRVLLGGSRNIIRAAADRLLRDAMFRQRGIGTALFDILNDITFLGYERSGAEGRLLVSASEALREAADVEFDTPMSLHDVRLVRKVLELSDESTAVLAVGTKVCGLVTGSAPPDTIEIRVQGPSRWEARYGEIELMRVSNGRAELLMPQVDRNEFVGIAERTVGDIDVERIWAIIRAAQRAEHGITLVISRDAAREATRLGGQAVPIKPGFLDPVDVARLGRVDGAVMLGPDGRCYAFGVILDGEATELHGSPARGSRFNSAIRYQRTQTPEALLVVISDDGMVDTIPQLRQRVHRSDIGVAVDAFLAAREAEPVDGEVFAEAHRRVEALAFYLTADECERVNSSYESEMRRRVREGGIAAYTSPLRPHPDMDDSYFL